MIKRVLLGILLLCLLAFPAAAWEQSFEGNDYDLPYSTFVINSGSIVGDGANGYCYYYSYPSHGGSGSISINSPFTGYLAYSLTVAGQLSTGIICQLQLYDTAGTKYYDSGWVQLQSATPSRIEFIETSGKTGIESYISGTLKTSNSYTTHTTPARMVLTVSTNSMYQATGKLDDFTTSSSRSMVSCDPSATVNDAGQYFRIGVPVLTGNKYYYCEVFSPSNQIIYLKNFNSTSQFQTQLIPVANMSGVGDYTIHLYRQDDEDSATFLNMKRFDVSDPASTGEGSIEIDKQEYESGENVDFWVHLNSYSSGYKVRCEFPTSGSNFRKEFDVTSGIFHGSFGIPDISAVIGSHRVDLINPSGKLVDSADFNVYVPGLPDIAFDKSEYERTEKALIYYKDVKEDSELTVTFRYGGTTAQTLTYNVEGTGTLTLDLSAMSAADSILAVVKDSDGYANDDDNAKIIVGNFELSGRVYNAKTGSAINGATVTVQGNSINSDINGNYNLSALAGFANYSVVANGYNSISGTVAVFDLKTIHNFYLSPVLENAGTGVYGTVVSAKTDYPLVGASVEVTNTDSLKRYSTIVDSKGYYSVSHDDLAGNLSIRVSYTNYDSIVSTALVSSGTMQNHNYRLNAVPGYEEIDPSEHTGGQDSDDTGETAEERAYREKYGEMGKHPFDFNGDGTVENSEWKYAFERIAILIGLLAFMGFMVLISRRR